MNASTKPVRIGVDIGGTFTDLQIFDARDGRIVAHKLPTTPEDPSIALVEGIKTAGKRYGFTLADVGYLMHGTTIATNAVLERKLPTGALVTTAGFEDVLEIGRHYRREIYSIHPQPVPALIPRNRRFGFRERFLQRRILKTGRQLCQPNQQLDRQHEIPVDIFVARIVARQAVVPESVG